MVWQCGGVRDGSSEGMGLVMQVVQAARKAWPPGEPQDCDPAAAQGVHDLNGLALRAVFVVGHVANSVRGIPEAPVSSCPGY